MAITSQTTTQLTPQSRITRSQLYDSMFHMNQAVAAVENPANHTHAEATPTTEPQATRVVKNLGMAAGLFGVGLLLHRLPKNPSSFAMLSSDWKDWAKIALGVMTVGKINKAFEWQPPPWLGAIQAVAVINPLVSGFKKGLPQLAVMAPLVAGVVQLSTMLSKRAEVYLKEKFNLPAWVPKLAISAALIGTGVLTYPHLFRWIAGTGVLGVAAKETAMQNSARAILGTEGAVCARGCCPSIICLSEIGEFIGGLHTSDHFRDSHPKAGLAEPTVASVLSIQPTANHNVRFQGADHAHDHVDQTHHDHDGHDHDHPHPAKDTRPFLIRMIAGIPKWFQEFFTGIWKDLQRLVQGTEEF